ncbi:hypothetical protein ABT173_40220 [Streptomyces sp. NPDC001795]|uniref:hypothetical protein n=1 Tax=Streptomyces sp. NPDC001795 TaxID=3154525 RepID=UPI003324F4BB
MWSPFAHAALEAGELRLTLRPHVMTPLYNELRATDAPVAKRGMRLCGWVAVQALLDAVDGPLALRRLVTRLALGAQSGRRPGRGKGSGQPP